MKRFAAVLAVVVAVCPLAFAGDLVELQSDGRTVADLMHAVRVELDRPKLAVIAVNWEDWAFLIPAAGSLAGANGTFFRSDVTLANRRSVAQNIAVLWFQRGVNNASEPVRRYSIPANTTTIEKDFVGTLLGETGLGAIMVIGLDAAGNVDTNAELDGFSRIWTPQPGAAKGSVSQEFTSVEIEDQLATSYGYGLRQDADYRTNVGFVNTWSTPNTFTTNVVGLLGSTSFTTTVQPYSMEQVPLPAGDWGDLYIRVSSAPSNSNWWSAYGTSVDNYTGDGWVSHVH